MPTRCKKHCLTSHRHWIFPKRIHQPQVNPLAVTLLLHNLLPKYLYRVFTAPMFEDRSHDY